MSLIAVVLLLSLRVSHGAVVTIAVAHIIPVVVVCGSSVVYGVSGIACTVIVVVC